MSILDNLFNDSDTKWLKDKCPSLFTEDDKIQYSAGGNMKQSDIGMSESMEYYEMVENGNEYVKNLLDKEESYLKGKYGESLYDYFIKERKKYIEKKKEDIIPSCQVNAYKLEQLIEIYNIYKMLEIKSSSTKGSLNDANLLNSRKFVYRNEIKSKIEKLNTQITILYFFVIASIIFYLLINKKLNIRSKWYLYLGILIIPFIVGYLYNILRSIVYSLKKTISNTGPKNAFLKESFV
tara:strand:- start:6810 stop:7520 length:711 start_codon:yes stop_codon:yes gene_type:complete